jgi:hypothetical protein
MRPKVPKSATKPLSVSERAAMGSIRIFGRTWLDEDLHVFAGLHERVQGDHGCAHGGGGGGGNGSSGGDDGGGMYVRF